MRCPSCATDNAPASASCAGCGVALPAHGGEPLAHRGEPPANGGEPPAAYQVQARYEMPPQYGPGWQPAPPYPGQPEEPYHGQPEEPYDQPQDPFAAYQTPTYLAPPPIGEPPPYADNAGPAYPTWLPSPTSGPGVPVSGTPMSGAPVSPGYPAAYPGNPAAYPGNPAAYPGNPAAYPAYPHPVVMAPSPRPRSRSMVGLVVAVAVVVVVAVASFAAVTLTSHKKTPLATPTGPASQQQQQTHSQTPQPTRTTDQNITATTAAPDPAIAHNQAAAIDSLLTASVNSRHKLNNAIDEVNRCTNLDGAVSDMNAAGQERQSQITSVRSTDLSAIPTGGQVRDLLLQALQYSQQADASFAAWAQGAVDNGCASSGQRDRDYAEAQRLSGLAKQAKTDFLATWNPVASANGVSARSPDDI